MNAPDVPACLRYTNMHAFSMSFLKCFVSVILAWLFHYPMYICEGIPFYGRDKIEEVMDIPGHEGFVR